MKCNRKDSTYTDTIQITKNTKIKYSYSKEESQPPKLQIPRVSDSYIKT